MCCRVCTHLDGHSIVDHCYINLMKHRIVWEEASNQWLRKCVHIPRVHSGVIVGLVESSSCAQGAHTWKHTLGTAIIDRLMNNIFVWETGDSWMHSWWLPWYRNRSIFDNNKLVVRVNCILRSEMSWLDTSMLSACSTEIVVLILSTVNREWKKKDYTVRHCSVKIVRALSTNTYQVRLNWLRLLDWIVVIYSLPRG